MKFPTCFLHILSLNAILLLNTLLVSCSKSTDGEATPDIPTVVDTEHPLDKGLSPRDYSYPTSAYNLTESLPHGYVTDGSVNYTEYLQAGIDDNIIVVFPDFPVKINKPGLKIGTNREIYFRKNSKVIMEGIEDGNYSMFRLTDAKNVLLKNIYLEGDRFRHLGTSGEWGMGITLSGSENITIDGAIIKNCWGDGIYFGQDSWNEASKGIRIINSIVDSCRRAGISIVSGDDVILERCILQNTYGPSIGAGLAIEANKRANDINDIRIKDCITANNQKVGIRIVTANQYGEDGVIKPSSISINNIKDVASAFGISFVLGSHSKTGGIDGSINLHKIILQNNSNHGVVNHTPTGVEVLFSVTFKDVYCVRDSKVDKAKQAYLNDLVKKTAYFSWK